MKRLKFNNRFVDELPADAEKGATRRQVYKACYSFIKPTTVSAPSLVSYAYEVAELFDLSPDDCQSDEFLQTFVGNNLLEGMQPYAMCYGGHQFGNWAGQLGDGRAINLGDVENQQGEHWELQLKGAGETPYSRTADGLAVLRSSVREYLCSEAMFHLGVPTTRALSLITTGEQVMRDMLYDGNPAPEPGAVVCRVAPSFIRFGSFQLFASRNEYDELRQLADFTISHYFPDVLKHHKASTKESYLAWFQEVCDRTCEMIVAWMRVGFVHGVMNTDNMSILGLTIDYGPYGWLDNFDPNWTPNTTDAQHARYRYGQQGDIALWNLFQLANALYPLIEETASLEKILQQFPQTYEKQWREMMAAKLGFASLRSGDEVLFEQLEDLLAAVETDMTIFYRLLASQEALTVDIFHDAYYHLDELEQGYVEALQIWLDEYQQRLTKETRSFDERQDAMNQVNPKYVFRNYLAQQAIDKAEQGDYAMVNELLELLRNPYEEQQGQQHFAQKRPDWARTKVGCSMLSCSS